MEEFIVQPSNWLPIKKTLSNWLFCLGLKIILDNAFKLELCYLISLKMPVWAAWFFSHCICNGVVVSLSLGFKPNVLQQ